MKLFITFLVALMLSSTQVGSASTNEFRESYSMIINYESEIRDVLESEGLEPFVVDLLIAQSKHAETTRTV
jgi:hypothetical protein